VQCVLRLHSLNCGHAPPYPLGRSVSTTSVRPRACQQRRAATATLHT
jgi:hypothetical protein